MLSEDKDTINEEKELVAKTVDEETEEDEDINNEEKELVAKTVDEETEEDEDIIEEETEEEIIEEDTAAEEVDFNKKTAIYTESGKLLLIFPYSHFYELSVGELLQKLWLLFDSHCSS